MVLCVNFKGAPHPLGRWIDAKACDLAGIWPPDSLLQAKTSVSGPVCTILGTVLHVCLDFISTSPGRALVSPPRAVMGHQESGITMGPVSTKGVKIFNALESSMFSRLVLLRQERICLQCRNPVLIPGLGRSPGEGVDYPLQYSCLENFMGREAWQVRVHEVAKSWT